MTGLALVLLIATTSCWADESGPSFGSPFRFTEIGGAAVYNAVCAGCHMHDGRGAVGASRYPAPVGDQRLFAVGYSIARVLQGKGAMPPFARTLSDDQVAAVGGFIRSQFANVSIFALTAAEVQKSQPRGDRLIWRQRYVVAGAGGDRTLRLNSVAPNQNAPRVESAANNMLTRLADPSAGSSMRFANISLSDIRPISDVRQSARVHESSRSLTKRAI